MTIGFIVHGGKFSESNFMAMVRPFYNPNDDLVEFFFTKHRGHGTDIARSLNHSHEVVVVVGGDGLLHECINGIMQLSIKPELILWPFGSGNDFSRNYKWTNNAQDVFSRIRVGNGSTCDIGEITSEGRHICYFINEMSIGLGPAVVKRVESYPASWNGNIKFGLGVISTFLRFKKPMVEMKINDKEYNELTMSAVVANGKFFGSGIGISPDASTSDGKLNLTIIGNVSILDYIRNLKRLRSCKRIEHPEVRYEVLESIRILTSTPIEADGELIDVAGKVEIQLHRNAIRLR